MKSKMSANSVTTDNLESPSELKISEGHLNQWQVNDVISWAAGIERFSNNIVDCIISEGIDGSVLAELNEQDIRDFRYRLNYNLTFGEMKKLWVSIRELQARNKLYMATVVAKPNIEDSNSFSKKMYINNKSSVPNDINSLDSISLKSQEEPERSTSLISEELIKSPVTTSLGSKCIPPDVFKTALSLAYSFLVTWITSFVMVIVHERVPDMKKYPPLPDIFLDNVPHIPWAFHMCEITGTLLFLIWSCVCIFHKHRLVLLRRFFALAGTVFLLRCVTMLITSLSVPGTHLQCNQKDYAVDDTSMSFIDALEVRISRAYSIWSGLGMSIQGVRTCGDYMFSGHTVALTLLNFFITEYTPRNLYFLHTLTWLLNMFGIFFILAAHEHYSIDVFVAFYITSRLFLYYHTLANNQALMSRDSTRTRIWFPMFSYFESSVEGIIPNEYDTISSLFDIFIRCALYLKDSIFNFLQRIWTESHKMTKSSNSKKAPNTSSSSYRKFINKENYQNNQDSGYCFSSDDFSRTSSLHRQQITREKPEQQINEVFASNDCKKSQ